jgi:hypothetical protein
MTIEQIQRQFAVAADDDLAPPTRVRGADVYRAGLRRRWARRCLSGTAAAAVLVAGVGAVVAVAGDHRSAPVSPGSGRVIPAPTGPVPAPPRPSATTTPPRTAPPRTGTPAMGRTCEQFAADVADAIASALDDPIAWGEPRVVPDANGKAPCEKGGIFWIDFMLSGTSRRLAFEGGRGDVRPGCDATRPLVNCEQIPRGQIGHYAGSDEYGVLFSRTDGVYFFLGIADQATTHPLTTKQLAHAAKRVADDVFT